MHYLSDEWIDAADTAVADLTPSADTFVVGYVVTGGPAGERSYTLRLGPDRVSVRAGSDAPVALRLTWDVAVAIAKGELSAQRAFLDGNMRIDGDAQALLGASDGLLAVDERLAAVRTVTQF